MPDPVADFTGPDRETLPFKIECLPDLPPVVAVLTPIQDIEVPAGNRGPIPRSGPRMILA